MAQAFSRIRRPDRLESVTPWRYRLPFPQSIASATAPRSAGRYRWVTVWLATSSLIALLLLANAVWDYNVVSRWLAIQRVRHQIIQITNQVQQELSSNASASRSLELALGAHLPPNESVTLRDSDGGLLAHLGDRLSTSPFTPEQVRHAFRHREALFHTVSTPSGVLVVEAYPLLPPPPQPEALSQAAANPPGPRLLTLEVALPLRRADHAVLAPIRRNLAINLVAALSLLATVVLAGVGLRSYAKGQRLEEQVSLAQEVQARLLPDPSAQPPDLQIATVYRPSEQVGGDFYDVFADPVRGFAAVIGDVSGKGLPAALLMGVIHGAVRTSPWQMSETNHEAESIRLNRLLCDRASNNRFASLFWCVYDRQRQTLRYVNAGHCPPFLLRRSPTGDLVATRLEQGGPVMGLLGEAGYRATSVTITPGDLLVLYSDGLIEANDAAGEEFGETRLEALLRARFDDPLSTVRSTLLSAWEVFSPPHAVQDDLTIVILRF